MSDVPKLDLTSEEVLELDQVLRILMGTIMKTNQFMLTLTTLTKEQQEELAVLLDVYSSLYDQFLTGEAKDNVIFSLTKGKMDS